MKKISIEDFLALAKNNTVLDVRSPGEYNHAHLPGAYNLPLFSDEERKIVGTAYKQQDRETAIKIGLGFFGVKMRKMVEEVESANSQFQIPNSIQIAVGAKPTILVHCWRGGMRSAGVAWLLDLYGFKVYTLAGGYKSFRNWVLQRFDVPYSFKILGGYTGSGKTEILRQLEKEGAPVICLESIARHKGSAFGALGEAPQPTQEMFENELGMALHNVQDTLQEGQSIWIEDESRRIGDVNLPGALWETMRLPPLYFLDIPFEERLDYITETYGKFEKAELVKATMRLQKRLGGQGAKDAINYLLDGDNKECFRILLRYYDKYYAKGLQERSTISKSVSMVACSQVDAKINSGKLTGQIQQAWNQEMSK